MIKFNKNLVVLLVSFMFLVSCGQSITDDSEDIPFNFFYKQSGNTTPLIKVLKSSKIIEEYKFSEGNADMRVAGIVDKPVYLYIKFNKKFVDFSDTKFFKDNPTLACLIEIAFMQMRRQDMWDPEVFKISVRVEAGDKATKWRNISGGELSNYIMDAILHNKEINASAIYTK